MAPPGACHAEGVSCLKGRDRVVAELLRADLGPTARGVGPATHFVSWHVGQRLAAHGLLYEDVMIETADVKLALKRMPKELMVAREQRLKRAMMLDTQQKTLPPEVAALAMALSSFCVVASSLSLNTFRPAPGGGAAETGAPAAEPRVVVGA